MMLALPALLVERHAKLGELTLQHLFLTGVAVLIAVVVGAPLGLLVTRNAKVRGPVLAAVGVVQTIPSIALLGLMLPLLGIGTRPAIVALTLYALLPIVRNTYAGLDGVPAELIEAADGIGFTSRQRFLRIELPLAMPVIVAGIRTSTVISVGVATLAAFIGAGGLGDFIFFGLQTNNTGLILLGAIPAALLALLLDFVIGRVELYLRRDAASGVTPSNAKAVAWAVLPTGAVALLALLLAHSTATPEAKPVQAASAGGTATIGSKDFTEQFLLGNMMADLVEAHTDLEVERKFGLAGTQLLHAALLKGDIDLYAEYSGTAYMDVLKQEAPDDPSVVFPFIQGAYLTGFNCVWLKPFGFNNTYTITVRGDEAKRRGWTCISDLAAAAPDLTAGFTGEFIERNDGYPGLVKRYGFEFGQVKMLDPGLMYQAVAKGEVDVICGFGTDGRIPAFKLQPLQDDRDLFPPYHAAPVVREDTLTAHPALRGALALLAGRLDEGTMQRLNYAVDEHHRPVEDVAREFLQGHGLLDAGAGEREAKRED